MSLPVNQMFILHAYENQLAFQGTLLRDKSINSKHRQPGWPTSDFSGESNTFQSIQHGKSNGDLQEDQ